MNPSDMSGAVLNELFCLECYGDPQPEIVQHERDSSHYHHTPDVTGDANACEAWAMRWARQAGLRYEMFEMQDHVLVVLVNFERDSFKGRGTDWKEAFVRACVTAGTALASQKDDGHATTC